ncbi:MAG: hypothetical protein AAB368_14290, partial [bacterium]
VAILALSRSVYGAQARRACDYLVRIQNADGSWCNQYGGTIATDSAKYTRHTVEVAIALAKVGGYAPALARARDWLLNLQDPAVKHGDDDGLVAGGYDGAGTVQEDRWTSDNAWAVLAFDLAGATAARDRVVQGINARLVSGDHWVQKTDKNGVTSEGTFGWINFAPAFAALARLGVTYPAGLAAGVRARLAETGGPAGGAVRELEAGPKYMPGIGFQASLAWNELGATAFTDEHTAWAQGSGLWQATADGNGDTGGWIDWTFSAGGGQANWWERFIDTSAYYIFAVNRWALVEAPPVPPPPVPPVNTTTTPVTPSLEFAGDLPAAGEMRIRRNVLRGASAPPAAVLVRRAVPGGNLRLRVYTAAGTYVGAVQGVPQAVSGVEVLWFDGTVGGVRLAPGVYWLAGEGGVRDRRRVVVAE